MSKYGYSYDEELYHEGGKTVEETVEMALEFSPPNNEGHGVDFVVAKISKIEKWVVAGEVRYYHTRNGKHAKELR